MTIIDRLNLVINSSILLACLQETLMGNTRWFWDKMVQNAAGCDSPDDWFASLVIPLIPEQFQKGISISPLLNIINSGFSRCTNYIPSLILLAQARMFIDRNNRYNSYYGVNEYNLILEKFKDKIAEAQEQLGEQTQGGKQ
jgi:hypothetical protein